MEEAEVIVVSIDQFQKDARVLLLEERLLRVVLLVGDGLLLLFDCLLGPKHVFWVCQHDVEPDILLNLLDDVRELLGTNAFDWIVILREGLEEGDDSFADAGLLPSFVDVNR